MNIEFEKDDYPYTLKEVITGYQLKKTKNNKYIADFTIILIAVLGRGPLGEAINLYGEFLKENKKHKCYKLKDEKCAIEINKINIEKANTCPSCSSEGACHLISGKTHQEKNILKCFSLNLSCCACENRKSEREHFFEVPAYELIPNTQTQQPKINSHGWKQTWIPCN